MNVLDTVVRGDPWRKTRLHDMKGNLIDRNSLLVDLPKVIVGAATRELLDYRPALPWIPYNAMQRIRQLARSEWNILEYGAGMSTIWFAHHCRKVHSIELDESWYRKVLTMLDQRALKNVDVELRNEENYAALSEFADASFDFVMIDGTWRDRCVAATLRLIKKPGGCMYLDNTDQGAQWDMYADAERLLREAAAKDGARVTFYTGFAPCTFVASEGMLVEW